MPVLVEGKCQSLAEQGDRIAIPRGWSHLILIFIIIIFIIFIIIIHF